MDKRTVPKIVGKKIEEARKILKKENIEIEKEKKKMDVFEHSGNVLKVEPEEGTKLKKQDKVTLYISNRKPILVIFLLFLVCVLFGNSTLGEMTIKGIEDKTIRVLNLSKPTAPEITGGSKEWALSRVIKVKKDSYAKKGLDYYEYCITSNKNLKKCKWEKTSTKNVKISETGKYYVVFRGVDKAGKTSSNSNIEIAYIDNNNPVINKVSIKNKKVVIEANDKESGIDKYYYSLDGENYKETKKKFEFKDDVKEIYIKVVDKVGNKVISVIPVENGKTNDEPTTTTKVTTTTTKKQDNNGNTNTSTTTTNVPNEKTTKNTGTTSTSTTTTTTKVTGTTSTSTTTTTKKGMEYDIPKINLDKVPLEFVYGSDYELPSEVDFGNDTGTYKCVVEGKEVNNTKDLTIGKHLIVCEATSSHNKRTMVEKEVEVRVKSGEEETWDGWIRLNLNYPDNSTNWEWRIGKEGEIRDGYDYTGWQDYTGPILVKLDDVKDVYIRYDLLGETYIIAPNGRVAVDIEPTSYALEGNNQTDVKIFYDKMAEVKEYRVAGGEWQEYTEPFKVGKNTLIEARGIRNEKVYDSDGNYLYTKKVTGTDSVFIGEANVTTGGSGTASGGNSSGNTFEYEPVKRTDGSITTKPKDDTLPSTYLEGPEIKVNPTGELVESVKVSVIPQEPARKIYIMFGYGIYQEYTGEITVSKNTLVRAYYVRDSDGKSSEVTSYYIQNIKSKNKPYVRIDATPDYLSKNVNEVKVSISGSNYTKLEYSLDGVIYQNYTGEITVTRSTTIYAKGTNEYGETIEELNVTTTNTPIEKDNIDISIDISPKKEDIKGLVNKAKVKITYENKATKKYYKLGFYEQWKEYTGEFEITDNVTIYAYATGNNAVGKTEKSIDYLTTGIANPIIRVEPTGKAQQVKVSIEYANTAEITRCKIGNQEYRDYNGSFYVYENETIYAYNKDELGNEGASEYTIKNIIGNPNYVAIDKGKYYIIKLNYPETSSVREYKWKSDGVWKEYNGYGVLLIKNEYKNEFTNIKDGIKVEDEYGKEIIFTDHYYFIDVPFSELMENLFMRWDTTKINAPTIIETPEEATKEASISIVYNKALVNKLYKIVYEDGEETEWLTYVKPFTINKNKATIFAKGVSRSGIDSKVASKTITNIDNDSPEIEVKGNFEKPARQINVTVNAKDDFGVDKVKWTNGEENLEFFKKNGNAIRNGSSFKVEENGKYTIYAVDKVGNEIIKVIEITNIDKDAPNIRINVLTETFGTEAEIEIDYGDSVTKQYKIGKNGTYKEYTENLVIKSNDVLDLANEDGSLTIYAKGKDEAGNEIEISEDIYILDLDAPKEPVITAGAGYPILTEYGVKLGSKSYIKFDDRDDITNYYSTDNGTSWKIYTGPFDITSGSIKARSVKNNSGLVIETTKEVDMPEDALGPEAYDEDENTYSEFTGSKKIFISPELIGKSVSIKAQFLTAYSFKSASIALKDESNTTLSNITITESQYSVQDYKIEIPENTKYILITTATSYNVQVTEISVFKTPVLNLDIKHYPKLTDYGIIPGNYEASINYFSTNVQRLYRINNGKWLEYEDKLIKLNIGDVIEAKGIDKDGKEFILNPYTIKIAEDAIGPEAYDGDETVGFALQKTKYYMDIDRTSAKKRISFKMSINHTYKNSKTTLAFVDAEGNELVTKSITSDGYGELMYSDEIDIPKEATQIIAYRTPNANSGTLYEMRLINEPSIAIQKVYPKLTDFGFEKGYLLSTINYYPTSVKKLYKINGSDWNDYDEKPIRLDINDIIEFKGIDKFGKETLTNKYEATLPDDFVGSEAYDADETTRFALLSNKYYIDIDKTSTQKRINIKISVNHVGKNAKTTIAFIDDQGNELTTATAASDGYSEIFYTGELAIPDEASRIVAYKTSNAREGYIYEISLATEPLFSTQDYKPMLTQYGVEPSYGETTIDYFLTSVQRLYRINDGEWKKYADKPIKMFENDKLEAKGIDKNGVETPIGTYTFALAYDSIGSAAYDNDINTSYRPPVSDVNFAKMKIDSSMIGKMVIIKSKSNANLYRFYDENLNQIGDEVANVTYLVVPEGAVWLYYGESRTAATANLCEIYPSKEPYIFETNYYPVVGEDEISQSITKVDISYLSYFDKKLYSLDNGNTWLDYDGSFTAKVGDKIQAKAVDKDGNETEVTTYTVKGLSDSLDNKAFDSDKSTSITLSSKQTKSFNIEDLDNEVLRIYTTGTISTSAYIKLYDKDGNELDNITFNTDLTTLVIPEGTVKASIYSGTSSLTIKEINSRKPISLKGYPEIQINDSDWTTSKKAEIVYPENTIGEYSLDLGNTWNKYNGILSIEEETTIFARAKESNKVVSSSSFIIKKIDNTEPVIELEIPETIVEESDYVVPTSTTFGNSGGKAVCKINDKEITSTKELIKGTYEIRCEAESNSGKKTSKLINLNVIEKIALSFDYTGSEQVFTAPVSGTYKLETWGAQGGTVSSAYRGGYGAYSTGKIFLEKSTNLYINIGGVGEITSLSAGQIATGGYNGGGTGANYIPQSGRMAGGGGGATHIAFVSGLLSSLENYKGELSENGNYYVSNKIIIVSGGGGGSWYFPSDNNYHTVTPGDAGGMDAVTSVAWTESSYGYMKASGGTQIGIGTEFAVVQGNFGQGASRTNKITAGGGGGFFGGNAGDIVGAGGSSYIGNPLLVEKAMYCYNCEESTEESTKTISTTNVSETPTSNYAKIGNGYARITYIGE